MSDFNALLDPVPAPGGGPDAGDEPAASASGSPSRRGMAWRAGRLIATTNRFVLAFLAIAAVAAGGIGVRAALAGETHDISGRFVLDDSSSYYTSGIRTIGSSGCEGTNGYDDINDSTQVTISDSKGRTLAVTELENGHTAGSGSLYVSECFWDWSADNVPDSDFYVVEVGHRGKLTFSKSDMESHDWLVLSSLGSD